jgi:hypothetical protein
MRTRTIQGNQFYISQFASTPFAVADRLVTTLVILGLIAAVATNIIFRNAAQEAYYSHSEVVNKTSAYYAVHGAQTVLLISAGLIALFRSGSQSLQPGYHTRFFLFMAATLLMTARGYSFSEMLSTKLLDYSGPFFCFISVLIFVGARPGNWRILGPMIVAMAVLFSLLVLFGMARLENVSRQETLVKLNDVLNNLYFPAAWVGLREYRRRSFRKLLQFVPMVIYGVGGVLTQTRLNFVMIFSFIVLLSYVRYRRHIPQAIFWIRGLCLVVWVGLFAAVFLTGTQSFESVADAATALSARVDEDTRTDQLAAFAESVAPQELVLGRGALATWNWHGLLWTGATDVGYLSLLFFGGVPLLLTYLAVHVQPCFSALRNSSSDVQVVGAAVVALWGIRMFSSSFPGFSPEYYSVLFCVGACLSRRQRMYANGDDATWIPRQAAFR